MSISDSNRGKVPKSRIFKLPPQEGDLEDYMLQLLFILSQSFCNFLEIFYLINKKLVNQMEIT